MEKTDPSLNKDEGIAQDADALREMEQELAFHLDPWSPTSNGYLEAVVINKKRKKNEEDIVNSTKQHKKN
ncbi:hypothetical protein JHK84_039164 [Glycine max]|nr:hypothetical protein JHK85_039519 [Glycine max]KAG5120824.1 hypothetical protein JHK84_039164 [Glycine max]